MRDRASREGARAAALRASGAGVRARRGGAIRQRRGIRASSRKRRRDRASRRERRRRGRCARRRRRDRSVRGARERLRRRRRQRRRERVHARHRLRARTNRRRRRATSGAERRDGRGEGDARCRLVGAARAPKHGVRSRLPCVAKTCARVRLGEPPEKAHPDERRRVGPERAVAARDARASATLEHVDRVPRLDAHLASELRSGRGARPRVGVRRRELSKVRPTRAHRAGLVRHAHT